MHRAMDCSVCLWLIISFCWAWGASPGPVRTVFGALGKPTLLDVTPDLQQLTTRFEKVVWKRDTSDPVTKSIILDYSGGNSSIKLNQSMRFHPTNFSLEILETSRQDAEMYTFTGTQQYEEKEVHLRLEVYEEVSKPIIQVSKSLSNESCTLTLNCTAERGDNKTYCWSCPKHHAAWPCLHNGSLFNLSLDPWETDLTCICTASNPVNHYSTHIGASAECNIEPRGKVRQTRGGIHPAHHPDNGHLRWACHLVLGKTQRPKTASAAEGRVHHSHHLRASSEGREAESCVHFPFCRGPRLHHHLRLRHGTTSRHGSDPDPGTHNSLCQRDVSQELRPSQATCKI